ncbi:protein-L-isoaspartate(D-aspartate) O-methyltransferase [Guyparkeria halophila]|uniref:Protein-L-isoaspartate O-methyltransferase n=1 Tax=Guyparkeria halophila TaxID=47960 RepID=A0ABZ0YV19_9GAMM|nr:protein-L-isoaspartate(D-aspartate) O-methyltransferase [Guyparkeria halophila]WQH16020.1 protein-L-isoaspartate(D-aspartate) O-methyltransferase [Guyparkeria halophila]
MIRRNYQWARQTMLERLVSQGVRAQPVLDAMAAVPREAFVDEVQSVRAYEDCSLPIGQGQTLSQPYIVARMTELVMSGERRLSRVLEVGTGSGYQAAVLAQLCQSVFTVERIGAFLDQAKARHRALGLLNIRYMHRDGFKGWPSQAPFEAIVVTAAPDAVPPELKEQLAVGGRLVIPVGAQGGGQKLTVITRLADNEYQTRWYDLVSFVPLLPGSLA